ncbi:protein SLOW WALKER 1-like [Nicotiana sylvestris]|uniref:U3 small nucleolar RNA-associated protein 15 homolog n=1 Tax=Nicotiana sylvestris TaxID=4096 RepID=A0A1U7XFA9_NICSY|nr:PREDICTED: U3 small nucleolar RNA-associated protein 15 homolog [Nicotiana sylvestris]
MAENQSIARTFPVKPKLKPTSANSTTPTPESKYWRSFKTPKDLQSQTLVSAITSLSFSPISPHDFAATHSATVSIFSGQTLEPKTTISSAFKDTVTSASFRSDGRLIAAGDLSGAVQVLDLKSRVPLRRLRGHTRPVRVVRYPRADKLHLFSGGDDAVVKYWDITTESKIYNLLGHKDYVRCGDASPVSDDMFVSGSYDHTVKVWDVRVLNSGSVMEFDHGKPVEDVIYLPSGGLVATAGGNSVKIWDVLGGGKLLYTMESHNKTVTSICVGKIGKESGEEAQQYRILSVSLDGYMKVFDYAKFKITHSMRFPNPLMSVGVSPDCSTRVIGASNGSLYIGRRKVKDSESLELGGFGGGFAPVEEPQRRVLRPSYFRYFQRGQNEKPSEWDYLIKKPKKIKVAEHDKLLKKFMHKEALVAALSGKNPENVVAVMEELVARKKLLRCVSNLETEELGLLLRFLQRYSTMPRFSRFLMGLTKKVIEMRTEDIKSSDELRGHIRNLKRDVEEEIRVQQTLQQIQGIVCPLLKIAARR